MTQLEIEFFWPLTEQIPLDLDFSECDNKSSYVYSWQGNSSLVGYEAGYTITACSTPLSFVSFNPGQLIFNNVKMPWYRKVLFKLMGFKWKQ